MENIIPESYSSKEELQVIVGFKVEELIDKIFVDVHQVAKTKSGDMSDKQHDKLNDIQKSLTDLIVEQVWQNI